MTHAFYMTGLSALLLSLAAASGAPASTAAVGAEVTAPGPSLAPLRQVCSDEIRASRALGSQGDDDFDNDLAALYDNLRRPPAAAKAKVTVTATATATATAEVKATVPSADPAAFSKDEDGRASYLLVSCLIYLVDSQRIDMDLLRIAQTWPDIKAQLIQGFGPVAAAPTAVPGAAQCEQAYAEQEAEFADIDRRNPARQPGVAPDSVPVLPGLQVALYMTSQRLLLLDTQCKGQARYAQYAAIRRQFDSAQRACSEFTGNTHDCQATLAW